MNKYDYKSLLSYIKCGRDKTTRKIANNTIARIEDDVIIVRYYDTDIVELYPDKVILHDGGYETYATKERLNWFLPERFILNQENFNWILRNYVTKEE